MSSTRGRRTYPTGNSPYSVAVNDFNHDGWPDLAVTNKRDGTVSILLNKGDGSGTFRPKVDYSVGGSPISIAMGSFRGKGKPIDLAAGSRYCWATVMEHFRRQ